MKASYRWCYILDLVEVNRLYIGSTNNLIRRVREHKGGWKGCYLTGKYTFKSIVACYPCNTMQDARVIESYLKFCSRYEGIMPLPSEWGLSGTKELLGLALANPNKRINDGQDSSKKQVTIGLFNKLFYN